MGTYTVTSTSNSGTPAAARRRPSRYAPSAPSRRIDLPSPGFFKLRLVKGGPIVPAVVRVENSRDEDGRVADRPRLVLRFLDREFHRGEIMPWWTRLHPIPESDYRRLCAGVVSDPNAPVDLSTAPPIF